jgi:hypothetical protein
MKRTLQSFEIDYTELVLEKKIGQGSFGVVWRYGCVSVDVIIHVANPLAEEHGVTLHVQVCYGIGLLVFADLEFYTVVKEVLKGRNGISQQQVEDLHKEAQLMV